MEARSLLEFLSIAEKLKCNTRHSWTSTGRKESIAEHTCRLAMFAWLTAEEFPELNRNRVMELCLFHDLGEAVAGDVPCFEKTGKDEQTEDDALMSIAATLPVKEQESLLSMFRELKENQTPEAALVHALDKMEALIQHNEAPIETWLPLEYDLQLTYGVDQAEKFPYTRHLRQIIKEDSQRKIKESR